MVRLAAPPLAGFGLIAAAGSTANVLPDPRRAQLLGHVIHTERDWIVERGTLGLGRRAFGETVRFLAAPCAGQDADDIKAANRYRRIAVIFHDPMLGEARIRRIAARMTPELKARATYALHVCHGLDEIRTLAQRLGADAALVRYGFSQSLVPPWRYLQRRGGQPAFGRGLTRGRNTGDERTAGRGAWPPSGPAGVGAYGQCDLASVGRAARTRYPGYSGEWTDLLAASLGEDATPRRSDPAARWAEVSSALIDPKLIARLCPK